MVALQFLVLPVLDLCSFFVSKPPTKHCGLNLNARVPFYDSTLHPGAIFKQTSAIYPIFRGCPPVVPLFFLAYLLHLHNFVTRN